jgi:threonine dehydratase
MSTALAPTPREVQHAAAWLHGKAIRTPMHPWEQAGGESKVWVKMECLQHGGSFKYRAALLHLEKMDPEARQRGITAVSAGNHAIAVAMAARQFGTTARVVMPVTANPFRVARCEALGAVVDLVPDVHQAFVRVKEIEETEGRTFIHPFEGPTVALGTGTVALEMLQTVPVLDALIVPIGGGGLAAGMAAYAKQIRPEIAVWGVEPKGADSMQRSLEAGKPVGIEKVQTLADSLGAPFAMPYSFGLCQHYLDGVVTLEEAEFVEAMRLAFTEWKLALEPAGAASLAALRGPLRHTLRGKRVGLIACGSNIDPDTFFRYLQSQPQ